VEKEVFVTDTNFLFKNNSKKVYAGSSSRLRLANKFELMSSSPLFSLADLAGPQAKIVKDFGLLSAPAPSHTTMAAKYFRVDGRSHTPLSFQETVTSP
jgi:hypothetical protein